MDKLMRYRFAIIGGGLTATSLLCQLVDTLEDRSGPDAARAAQLEVEVFERHPEVGPGLPHNPRFVRPYHITNMCAGNMTVRISRPDDFQRWLDRTEDVWRHRFARQEFHPPTPGDAGCRHYPRELMGRYLMDQFDDAVARARQLGARIKVWTECEVVDLWAEDSRLYLGVAATHHSAPVAGPFQGALLATGHWFEKGRCKNYFSSPWPASHLHDAIPPGATVGVIGSSLSAIETALTLSAEGVFRRDSSGSLAYTPPDCPRRVTLFSRQGFIPQVRGRIGTRRNRFFTCARLRELMAEHGGRVKLMELFDLLDRELSAAYGAPTDWRRVAAPGGSVLRTLQQGIERAVRGDGAEGELVWQTVLVQIFPAVRAVYLSLAEAERQRFDREFNTLFFAHAATQPVVNAEKLLALMQAGMVQVVAVGTHYRFEYDESSERFQLSFSDADSKAGAAAFTHCVDARGQQRSIATDPAPLTRKLLGRGLVQAAPGSTSGGSMLIDPATHRVIQPGAGAQEHADLDLFAVGAMTRDQIIDASMAAGLARSTLTIAQFLTRRLSETENPD